MKNTLYAFLWAVITLISAPIIAMDIQSSTAPMSIDEKAPRGVKRPAPTSDSEKKEKENFAKKSKKESKKEFECPTCGETYDLRQSLTHHVLTHGEKNVKCPTSGCTKKFYTQGELNAHVRSSHINYSCPECAKGFKKELHLKNHLYVHTGEKNHACEACNSTFTFKHSLTAHMKTHKEISVIEKRSPIREFTSLKDPESGFDCSVCGKKFLSRSKLERHMEGLHNGKKPLKCTVPECSKTFHQQVNLNTHVLNVHNKGCKFQCKEKGCERLISSKGALKKHMERKHSSVTASDHDESQIPLFVRYRAGALPCSSLPRSDVQSEPQKSTELPQAEEDPTAAALAGLLALSGRTKETHEKH